MSKKVFTGEKQNLHQLVKDVEAWLRQEGFEVQSGGGDGNFLVQARKQSTWRSLLGNNQTIDVKIEGTPENCTIELDAANWFKKLAEGGAKAFVAALMYAPLTPISAAWSASERIKIENGLWHRIGAPEATGERLVWYFTKNKKEKIGPVSEPQLKELARAGEIQPGDMVRQEGAPKWEAASSVQRLFHNANPFNTADCPKCATAVTFKPPRRSTQQLWEEFVPWYKQRFNWALDFGGVKSVLAQAALWYIPGCAATWVPVWFLQTTKPLYTTVQVNCPKCTHNFEALSEGKNPRFVPFDWANLAANVATAAAVVVGIYLALVAIVVIVVGAAALAFGVAAAATAPSSQDPDKPEPRTGTGPKSPQTPQKMKDERPTPTTPPQRWAVGVKGAVVADYDPTSGHGHYHKKCDACGFVDGSKTGFVLTSGNTDGSFFCPKCKIMRDVVVEIGRA